MGLCGALRDDELLQLSRTARRKVVPAGAVVALEGDLNLLFASVASGGLKLLKSTSDGRQQAVGLLGQGDFFGQPFSAAEQLTAIALTETELCIFPRGPFEQALDDQPRLERALLELTMRSLNQARERQLTLARKGAQARIAGFLLDLIEAGSGGSVELPMSRGDIADYLGLTIETVSRQFTELKAAGIIAAGRGGRSVTVHDHKALQRIAKD